jgi:hypothetical protein
MSLARGGRRLAGTEGLGQGPRSLVRAALAAATAAMFTLAAAGSTQAQQGGVPPPADPPLANRDFIDVAPVPHGFVPVPPDRAVRDLKRKLEEIADRVLDVPPRRKLKVRITRVRQAAEPVAVQAPDRSYLVQLEVEMAFVRKVCPPPLDQIDPIRNDLKKCLIEGAQGPARLPCEVLQERLVDAVALHLSRSEAAFYRAEVQKRRNHERAACVDTFVVLLDQQMSLSEKQRQALVAALLPKWRPDWSQTVEVACGTGETTLPEVPNELIEPLLDAEQITIWKGWPKNGVAHPPFNPLRIGSTGVTVAVPMDQ